MKVPSRRSILVLFLLLSLQLPTPARAQGICASTVPAGGNITRAVAAAAAGSTICLEAGEYTSFLVDRTAAARVTVQGAGLGTTRIVTTNTSAVQVVSAGLTLSGVTLQGGSPSGVYVAGGDLTLRDVEIVDALVGVHAGERARVVLAGVTVTRPHDVGVLVRQAADLKGSGVLISDSTGYGVAVAATEAGLELTNSEVRGGVGPGVFAGVPGCGALAAGTLETPDCFLAAPETFVSNALVTLTRVRVERQETAGMLFHPGVRAAVRESVLAENLGGGLFAWGADVEVRNTQVTGNTTHGLLFRAFPDPRAQPVVPGAARVFDTTVRDTHPLGGPYLGDGIMAEGGVLRVEATYVRDSGGMGLAYRYGASGAALRSVLHVNAGAGFCVMPGSVVEAADNLLGGNGNDQAGPCDVAPPAPVEVAPVVEEPPSVELSPAEPLSAGAAVGAVAD